MTQSAATLNVQNGKSAVACVLVADSDADMRAVYRRLFGAAGHQIIEAADGHDALVKALVRIPTLVVTELDLPLLDGGTLCAVLRRDRVTSNMAVVVVTCERRAEELHRARQSGADAVLSKPPILTDVFRESQRLLAYVDALTDESVTLSREIVQQLETASLLRIQAPIQRKRPRRDPNHHDL